MRLITGTVSIEATSLIPLPESPHSEADLVKNILIDHYTDILNDIYDTNVISTDKSLEKLDHITSISDPDLKGAALATVAGVHTFTGDYNRSFSAFHRALALVKTPELQAIVYSELSALLRKLGYEREAVAILDQAEELTQNKKLTWKLRTQKALCYEDSNPELSLEMLSNCLKHYQLEKNHVRIARILRHMASSYRNLGQLDKAESLLEETAEIAVEKSLSNILNSVHNDKGWLLIQNEEYNKARELFNKLIKKNLTPYPLALALQNIGYLEFERENYREAVKHHIQSLRITTIYEMRDMAFEDYYKLGLCHEKLGEPSMAYYFYQQGFLELQKEIDAELRLTGYRKKLLNAYTSFLDRNQSFPHIDIQDKIFGYAMNKTLQEIREIFHRNLLTLHLERTKNAPEMCRHLKINTRTYFKYQKKLDLKRGQPRKGPLEDDVHFNDYIESLIPLTWRQANEKFEENLFAYIMSKYQHNKKKAAEALGVSYALVVLKTSSAR